MSDTITIKKGSVIVTLDKMDFIQVDETADGLVFNFKGGLHLHLTDDNMPSETKQKVKIAADTFQKASITFDLMNYAKPALVEAL